MTRVKVFIDYQNVYHGARDAFGAGGEHAIFGHVRPVALGVALCHLGREVDEHRKLVGVEVFRGEPTEKSHPLLQAAFQKQVAAWRTRAPLVQVHTRPLRYRATRWESGRAVAWDAQEKGIDVMLALRIVLGAVRDEYDVAVVASGDTDLIPALDEVAACGKRVENAVWKPDDHSVHPARPLRFTSRSRRLWSHRLDRRFFEHVSDRTDYAHDPADPSTL